MTISVYAEVGSNFQQVGGSCPNGWIVMSEPRPESTDYTAQQNGSWVITQETINAKFIPVEEAWRESEMLKAQQNVTALTYGAEDVPGTVADWQEYWLALRKWNESNPEFPDKGKRPVQPS